MKHSFKRAGISKAAKAARLRNFRLYRLSGMLGNLAQMRYECRNNPALIEGIETAMDSVHALIQQIREEATSTSTKLYIPERKFSLAAERAFLLHGAKCKLDEIYNSLEQ